MPIFALKAHVVNELDYTFMVYTDKEEADRKREECAADLDKINSGKLEDEEEQKLVKKWFKYYYGGCGEIHSEQLKVEELQPGVPFASFSLD